MRVEVNEQERDRTLRALAALMVEDKETKQRIVKGLRSVLRKTRNNITKDVRGYLENDPRKAYQAVKSSVYRRILGGNVSILPRKRAGTRYMLVRERKLDQNPHQWGGNRRKRSERTEQVDTYYGKDRAFILRFLDAGTDERNTRYGRRGSIRARRLFETPAAFHIEWAAETFANTMITELEYSFDEKYNR